MFPTVYINNTAYFLQVAIFSVAISSLVGWPFSVALG